MCVCVCVRDVCVRVCLWFRSVDSTLSVSLISAGVGRSRSGTFPLIYSGRSVCVSASVSPSVCARQWCTVETPGSTLTSLLAVSHQLLFCSSAEFVRMSSCLCVCACIAVSLCYCDLKAGLCVNTWSLTETIPTRFSSMGCSILDECIYTRTF